MQYKRSVPTPRLHLCSTQSGIALIFFPSRRKRFSRAPQSSTIFFITEMMASKSFFNCGSGREPFSYMNYSNSVCVSPSYFGEYILTFLLSMTSSSFPIQHIVWEYKDSTSFWISKSNFTFLLSFGPSWLRCHAKEAMDEEFWICIIVFFQNSCTSQIKAIPSHQQFLPRLFTESVPRRDFVFYTIMLNFISVLFSFLSEMYILRSEAIFSD